jgi:hypothetical protein
MIETGLMSEGSDGFSGWSLKGVSGRFGRFALLADRAWESQRAAATNLF